LTYCAVGALSFLGEVPEHIYPHDALPDVHGISFEKCLECIISRQTTFIEEDNDEDGDSSNAVSQQDDTLQMPATTVGYLSHLGPLMIGEDTKPEMDVLEVEDIENAFGGFNGRPNKIADTCYAFWNMGALMVSSGVLLWYSH
jgi:geranylgeranyl transferase type-1 subunit beta